MKNEVTEKKRSVKIGMWSAERNIDHKWGDGRDLPRNDKMSLRVHKGEK